MTARFRAAADEARSAFRGAEQIDAELSRFCEELDECSRVSEELRRLGERMQAAAESGRVLLARITASSGGPTHGREC